MDKFSFFLPFFELEYKCSKDNIYLWLNFIILASFQDRMTWNYPYHFYWLSATGEIVKHFCFPELFKPKSLLMYGGFYYISSF